MSGLRRVGGSAIVAVLVATAVVWASGGVAAGGSSHGGKPKPPVKTTVRKLAPGVKLTTIVDRRIPRRTYILAVDPAKGATLDVVLGTEELADLERTSSMAKRTRAIAAVNGDFGTGRPVHPMAIDGELVQSSLALGSSFAMTADGGFQIGTPQLSASFTDAGVGQTWSIGGWNSGRPDIGDLNAYTEVGGADFGPPRNSCWATLTAQGEGVPGPGGVTRPYLVDQAACTPQAAVPGDGLVLAALPGTDEATIVRTLVPGHALDVTWSLGRPGVVEAIGGDPLLVSGGQNVLGPCVTALCRANPRTAVAVRRDGVILLVVIDGRQKGSRGMTLGELTSFLIARGAVQAMNLDGGGSSTMVAKRKVVSRPSDGVERKVSSAIVVHPPEAI